MTQLSEHFNHFENRTLKLKVLNRNTNPMTHQKRYRSIGISVAQIKPDDPDDLYIKSGVHSVSAIKKTSCHGILDKH